MKAGNSGSTTLIFLLPNNEKILNLNGSISLSNALLASIIRLIISQLFASHSLQFLRDLVILDVYILLYSILFDSILLIDWNKDVSRSSLGSVDTTLLSMFQSSKSSRKSRKLGMSILANSPQIQITQTTFQQFSIWHAVLGSDQNVISRGLTQGFFIFASSFSP